MPKRQSREPGRVRGDLTSVRLQITVQSGLTYAELRQFLTAAGVYQRLRKDDAKALVHLCGPGGLMVFGFVLDEAGHGVYRLRSTMVRRRERSTP